MSFNQNAVRMTAAMAVLAASLGCLSGARAAEEGGGEPDLDVIRRVDDLPVPPTKIFKDDYITVEGKKGNVPIKVESWAVKEVLYADRSPTYSTALDKRDKGNFVTAAKGFRIALDEMKGQKWAAEYCNFGMGDALYQGGYFQPYTDKQGHKYEPPSVYFRETLKANPKSRFGLEASVKLAISLAEEGKFDEAEAAFKDAEAAIKKYRDEMGKVNPKYREIADKFIAMSTYGHARMLERKAGPNPPKDYDFNPALSKYRGAQSLAQTAKAADVYGDSVDGELGILVKMNDYEAAKARAAGIIEQYKEKSDPMLLGMLPGAYTVMGLSNFNLGAKYKENKQAVQAQNAFAEARWNFLHVVVKFFDNDQYVAKAHYFAGLCYDELKAGEPDAVQKALRHFNIIVNNYPNTPFAELAKKDIERLGGNKAPEPVTEKPAEKSAAPVKEEKK